MENKSNSEVELWTKISDWREGEMIYAWPRATALAMEIAGRRQGIDVDIFGEPGQTYVAQTGYLSIVGEGRLGVWLDTRRNLSAFWREVSKLEDDICSRSL